MNFQDFLKLEYRKESEIIKLQEKRLRKIVKFAYDNAEFYNRKFKEANLSPDDIKNLEDLKKIPFLKKEDIVKNPLSVVGDKKNLFKLHTTSGTSGKGETIVYFTYNDWEHYVLQNARCLNLAGFTKGDRVYNSTPYGLFFAGQVLHDGAVAIGAFVIPASSLKTGAAHLKNIGNPFFHPTAFVGLPQYFLRWGNTWKKEGGDPAGSSLKKAYVLGEPVPSPVRKKIEDIWKVDCRVGYGLTEVGAGAECEEKNGYHWPEDEIIVECIDLKTGEPVDEGEKGELIYTTLTKTGTIALRYKSSDESAILGRECSCGRTHVKLKLIETRIDDLTKIKGTLVSPFAIEDALFSHNIEGFLCVVDRREDTDLVRIYVKTNSKNRDSLMDEIITSIKTNTKFSPTSVHFVNQIPEIGRKGKRFVDLRKFSELNQIVVDFEKQFLENK
ncbi:MAG: phenylacetate--CoA ligase family protein [Candidatus Lokiarchaeota archaeon]|nr:phenylacetate--CoA ligase family protein [Candidatus Lokiarchaeota archaeon]